MLFSGTVSTCLELQRFLHEKGRVQGCEVPNCEVYSYSTHTISFYLHMCSLPCNFFKTATSILSTCFGCRADSTFNATCSRVIKSKPS